MDKFTALIGEMHPGTALYTPPAPDPEREAIKRSRQAAMRKLQSIALDPSIPANEKIMCNGCQAFIPPGDDMFIHYDHRMFLAKVNCSACREENPEKDWLYIRCKEVGT